MPEVAICDIISAKCAMSRCLLNNTYNPYYNFKIVRVRYSNLKRLCIMPPCVSFLPF